MLEQLGLVAVQLPAVFVQNTAGCQGSNGVRLAKRNAWHLIGAGTTSVGLFEDDIVTSRQNQEWVRARLATALAEHDAHAGDLTFLEDGATLWWRGGAVWHSPRAARALYNMTESCNEHRGQGVDRHHAAVCATMNCKRVGSIFVQNRSVPPYLHNRKNQYIGHKVGRWSTNVTYVLDDEGVLRPDDVHVERSGADEAVREPSPRSGEEPRTREITMGVK